MICLDLWRELAYGRYGRPSCGLIKLIKSNKINISKNVNRGVKGRFLNVFAIMFKNSRCRVKVNGELSGEIDSLCGVLQEGMISPKLFKEYLCDI